MFYKESSKGFQIVVTQGMLDLQCPFSYISTPAKAEKRIRTNFLRQKTLNSTQDLFIEENNNV
jgi:hypothetical protein